MLKGIRKCPICGNIRKNKQIFVQRFANKLEHNIVACSICNFVFVSNTPDQKSYNKYYKDMSKYELERDQALHKLYVNYINQYAKKESKILDVGCSTGHLLALLKKSGFTGLTGIDPSPVCKKIAMKKFKISIDTAELFSYKPKKSFDFIILAMVLEHVEKISDAIGNATSLLSDNGAVFISVPNAANFYIDFDEPFGEFSTEHINFFSSHYLFRLMKGYECCFLQADNKNIFSIWKKTKGLSNAVNQYISVSKYKMNKITDVISGLPDKVMVWGAGSLTQRLLQSTEFKKKITKFIDSDSKLAGKKLDGIEIISPGEVKDYKEPILISSFRFKDEISTQIKQMNFENKILKFN